MQHKRPADSCLNTDWHMFVLSMTSSHIMCMSCKRCMCWHVKPQAFSHITDHELLHNVCDMSGSCNTHMVNFVGKLQNHDMIPAFYATEGCLRGKCIAGRLKYLCEQACTNRCRPCHQHPDFQVEFEPPIAAIKMTGCLMHSTALVCRLSAALATAARNGM